MSTRAAIFPYEVVIREIRDSTGFNSLNKTYEVLNWLADHKMFADRDYQVDMHGGQIGFSSFWFKEHRKALFTKLVWG